MNKIGKKAIKFGKCVLASGVLIFFIFLNTDKGLAVTEYPYLIKVNRYHNTITIYEKDQTGQYNKPVKAIVCSVGQKGTETVLGTYRTQGKYRWKLLMGDVWGQYSTRIVGGILFHSVYYYEQGNPASLAVKEFNKLGSPASHGCIRMTVADAKWIYDNCPVGTTVIIYDDKKSPGPLGKPEPIRITSKLRWDPTDPSKDNPYNAKQPVISGAKNKTIPWGEELNLLEGIKAKSSLGTDITEKLTISGQVDWYKAGTYKITYSVTDILNKTAAKTIKVTVEDNMEMPEFIGIQDRVVSNKEQVTYDNAMKGVKVIQSGNALKKKQIEVVIDRLSAKVYEAVYNVYVGEKLLASASAKFFVDDEAPVISGVRDRVLEPGQIPDRELALKGVSITDNYSEMDIEDIKVTIEEVWEEDSSFSEIEASSEEVWQEVEESIAEPIKPQLSYLISYEAKDEVGNTVKATANFHY